MTGASTLTTQEKILRLLTQVEANTSLKGYKMVFGGKDRLWRCGFIYYPPFPYTACPKDHDTWFKDAYAEHANFDTAVDMSYQAYRKLMVEVNGCETPETLERNENSN